MAGRLDGALDQLGALGPEPLEGVPVPFDLEAIAARYVVASPHYADSPELAASVDDVPDLIARVVTLTEANARLLRSALALVDGRLSLMDVPAPTDVHFRRESYRVFLDGVTA